MPKRKSGKKLKIPSSINSRIIGVFIGASVVAVVAGGVVYAKIKQTTAAIKAGGVRVGVWFDPDTGEPQVETGKFGCCRPICSDSFELECQQLGEGMNATFDERKCSDIDECKKGCCQVDCRVRKLPKEACEYMGGDWSETCEIGCCKTEYSENEIPEKVCKCDSSATWYPGTCAKGWSVIVVGGQEGKITFTDDWGDKSMGAGLDSLIDMFGGDRDQSIYYEYDLYNCSDSVYDTWYGTKKTVSSYGGETKTDVEDEELTISENGIEFGGNIFPGTAYIGGEIKISGNKMIMDYKMPLIGNIHAEGTIMKGAPECENRKTLDF